MMAWDDSGRLLPGGMARLRQMQREAMSRFATSTAWECTTELDHVGAGARHEIVHDAPPQV